MVLPVRPVPLKGHPMISVFAAIVALVVGVMLVPLARERPSYMAGLDGFMLVSVGGVLAMGLLPHSLETAGWPAAGALVMGMALPMLLEHGHHHEEHTHDSTGFLFMSAFGLSVHAFLDGGALATRQISDTIHARALEMGVLLHRLPMGVMLGMIGGERRQAQVWLATGVIALGTIAGYWFGVGALPSISIQAMAIFQAFVAGTLFHVLYLHNPIRIPSDQRKGHTTGMLAGIICLAIMHELHN